MKDPGWKRGKERKRLRELFHQRLTDVEKRAEMVIHVWAGDGRGGASEARCLAQSRAPLPVRVSVQDLMKAGERRLEERCPRPLDLHPASLWLRPLDSSSTCSTVSGSENRDPSDLPVTSYQ